MKYELTINGQTRAAELSQDRLRLTIDGREIGVNAAEVEPGIYSVLLDGRSFEVRLDPQPDGAPVFVGAREYRLTMNDPRQWRRDRGAAAEADGRQQLVAPMPGKVVRVLANV